MTGGATPFDEATDETDEANADDDDDRAEIADDATEESGMLFDDATDATDERIEADLDASDALEAAADGTGTPFDDATEASEDDTDAADLDASEATDEATTGADTPFDDAADTMLETAALGATELCARDEATDSTAELPGDAGEAPGADEADVGAAGELAGALLLAGGAPAELAGGRLLAGATGDDAAGVAGPAGTGTTRLGPTDEAETEVTPGAAFAPTYEQPLVDAERPLSLSWMKVNTGTLPETCVLRCVHSGFWYVTKSMLASLLHHA